MTNNYCTVPYCTVATRWVCAKNEWGDADETAEPVSRDKILGANGHRRIVCFIFSFSANNTRNHRSLYLLIVGTQSAEELDGHTHTQ